MLNNTLTFFKNKQFISIGFLFAIGSLMLGIWVAALPAIKERLAFTDAALGLSLLLAPAGSFTGVFLAPKVFSKIKVGQWLLTGPFILCTGYTLQVVATQPWMFWLALYITGLSGFLNGVSTNAVVTLIEQRTGARIMSTCHGMYSLGGGVSAGLAVVFYLLHVPDYLQMLLVFSIIAVTVISIRKMLLHYNEHIHAGTGLATPPLSIAGLSLICFVIFMAEGCVADWSAIYLKESLHSSVTWAGLGFAGFSVMMAISRFNGDALVPKIGAKKVVVVGSLLAAFGFLLVVIASAPWLAITGFTIVGIGCSCIVPILINAAAIVPGVSPVIGISAVFSGGLIGFLTGPSVIGILSEKFNLSIGLSFVLLLCILAAIAAMQNRYLINSTAHLNQANYNEPL